jgi:hypothetical protein
MLLLLLLSAHLYLPQHVSLLQCQRLHLLHQQVIVLLQLDGLRQPQQQNGQGRHSSTDISNPTTVNCQVPDSELLAVCTTILP